MARRSRWTTSGDNMTPTRSRNRSRIRIRVAAIVLIVASGSVGSASSRRMPDGKQWMTDNLNVDIAGSFCHGDAEANCRRYGRLYTWESAKLACRSLGDGWRLPTNDDWQQMAKHFGGVRDDSSDGGKAAFKALITGGDSGFNAVYGGNRDLDGKYARLEAHGLYWTASESEPGRAWLYNLGKNGQILNRHSGNSKQMAFSVRCVRD